MRKEWLSGHNLSLMTIALSLVIWIGWRGGIEALALEHSNLAWLQGMMLIACAITSTNIAILNKENQLIWHILSGLLLCCALDERFMWHEHIQQYIYFHCIEPSAKHAKWIHAITLFYVGGGIGLLVKIRSVCHKHTFQWFSIAIYIGSLAVLLDILFDSMQIQAYEEVLEYFSEILFLSGLINELRKSQSFHY